MTHAGEAGDAGFRTVRGAPLRLVRRGRVGDLVGGEGRREASGVLVRAGELLVVSDNTASVAVLDPGLSLPGPHHEVPLTGGRGHDYEDITADSVTGRLFVLIEALPPGPPFHAEVEEYDTDFGFVTAKRIDVPLDQENKGIEGLAAVRRAGVLHLLGLYEGRGRSGATGDIPGGGRIAVLTETADGWARVAKLRLPPDLSFVDYSGVAVRGTRIAVVSQESSALWLGQLDPATWTVDAGVVHEFPRDDAGRPLFTEVEGVDFLAADQIVVATDRGRGGEHRAVEENEQSVAVFDVPS